MYEWNRLPPVSLSGKEPVTELVVGFFLPKSFPLGFFCEFFSGFGGGESGKFGGIKQYAISTKRLTIYISLQKSFFWKSAVILRGGKFFEGFFWFHPEVLNI